MSIINKKNQKWWTLGTVCLALFMILLDGNVVNLAIPRIIKTFGASLSEIEWVNNAYLLTFAVLLITFGRLGDELGRKKMFMGGLVAFILGSVLCGLSGNVSQLISFRIIQGIGGAAMMPATLSLISANFEKKERGTAMGIWGAVSGLAIVLGPIIGGYLTDKGLGDSINQTLHIADFWRYVFYINIPIGILAFILSAFVIRESKDTQKSHKYDLVGIVLSTLSILTLTYGFIEGSKYGWWTPKEAYVLFNHTLNFSSLSIIPILFLISVISGVAFVLWEKNQKVDPLMDINFFKSRNFSVGNFAGAVLNFAMMGSFFLLPLFLQGVLNFSPIKTGQVMLPLAVAIMFSAPIAGKLSDKIGPKYLIVSGMIIMSAGGLLLSHLTSETTIRDLIFPFVVMGLGMGLSLSPLTNITLYDISEEEIGGASGVFSTTRQIGSVMGIAILGALLSTAISSSLTDKLNNISEIPESARTKIVDIVLDSGYGTDAEKMQEDIKREISSLIPTIPKAEMPSPEAIAAMTPDQVATVVKKQQEAQKQAVMAQAQMMEKMKNVGTEIKEAGVESFVDGINKTFRTAAFIALFGGLLSLLFRRKQKI